MNDVSPLVFEQLRSLAEPAPEDANTLRCVQLSLVSGAVFDVYRAREVNPALPVWAVRGFHREGDAPDVERRGLVMGTRDGRAMLTDGALLNAESAGRSEMVSGVTVTNRALGDLSEVIAAAVRRLMAES